MEKKQKNFSTQPLKYKGFSFFVQFVQLQKLQEKQD